MYFKVAAYEILKRAGTPAPQRNHQPIWLDKTADFSIIFLGYGRQVLFAWALWAIKRKQLTIL